MSDVALIFAVSSVIAFGADDDGVGIILLLILLSLALTASLSSLSRPPCESFFSDPLSFDGQSAAQ